MDVLADYAGFLRDKGEIDEAVRVARRVIEVGRRTQAVLWDVTMESPQTITVGFPPNRGGFLYAAPGWMAAIFSYSTGGSKPAELCRRRRL